MSFIPGRQILRNPLFSDCVGDVPRYWEVEGGRCCTIEEIGSAVCRKPDAEKIRISQFTFSEYLVSVDRAMTIIALDKQYNDTHVLIELDYGSVNEQVDTGSPFTVKVSDPPFNLAVVDSLLGLLPWRLERFDLSSKRVVLVARAVGRSASYVAVNRSWRLVSGGVAPEERAEKDLSPPYDYPDNGPRVFNPLYLHFKYGPSTEPTCNNTECTYRLGNIDDGYSIEVAVEEKQNQNKTATIYAWCSDDVCSYGVFARLEYVYDESSNSVRPKLVLGYVAGGNESVLSESFAESVPQRGIRIVLSRNGSSISASVRDAPNDSREYYVDYQSVSEVSATVPTGVTNMLGKVAKLVTRNIDPVFVRALKGPVRATPVKVMTMWLNKTNCVNVTATVVITRDSTLKIRMLGPNGANEKTFTLKPEVPGEKTVTTVTTSIESEEFPIWGFEIETNADAIVRAWLYGCMSGAETQPIGSASGVSVNNLFTVAREFSGLEVNNVETEGKEIPWLCRDLKCAVQVVNVLTAETIGRRDLFELARELIGHDIANVSVANPVSRQALFTVARIVEGIGVVYVHNADHCGTGQVPWRLKIVDDECNPVSGAAIFVLMGKVHMVRVSESGYALMCLPPGVDPNSSDIKMMIDRSGRVGVMVNVSHLVYRDLREHHDKYYYVVLTNLERVEILDRVGICIRRMETGI